MDPDLPFSSSRCQVFTIAALCLRWWISHRDSVWMLCWLLFSSASFLRSAVSVNADMVAPAARAAGYYVLLIARGKA